jgi:hypothetical protein
MWTRTWSLYTLGTVRWSWETLSRASVGKKNLNAHVIFAFEKAKTLWRALIDQRTSFEKMYLRPLILAIASYERYLCYTVAARVHVKIEKHSLLLQTSHFQQAAWGCGESGSHQPWATRRGSNSGRKTLWETHQQRVEWLKMGLVWGTQIDPVHQYSSSRWRDYQSILDYPRHLVDVTASPIAESIYKKEWWLNEK